MARTVEEIKQEIENSFIANQTIIDLYQLDTNKTFAEQFSAVSLESIIIFVVAFSIFVLEKIFATHKSEVDAELDTRLPHRRKWYWQKVLRFQYPNRALIPDTDRYDNTGLSDADIEDLQVVKFCAVHERGSTLFIKVAKGEVGNRAVLDPSEADALNAYITEIKDAGVPFQLINQQADKFRCQVTVLYNPMLLNPANKPCETAINNYVTTLDFNGEYRNVTLIDVLQEVPGVVIPHLIVAETQRAFNNWEVVDKRTVPESGYFIVENESDIDITYTLYEHLQN